MSVLYPVRVGFMIIADKNAKQDDHGNLPHKANRRETKSNHGVFWAVTKFPEALDTAHVECCFKINKIINK